MWSTGPRVNPMEDRLHLILNDLEAINGEPEPNPSKRRCL